MDKKDNEYMKRAIALAGRGVGKVNPNPLVGAVIVRDGQVIAEGWHERFGGLHAERNAFAACAAGAEGATLYVTLEPCCHYGKTPPCTEAVIEHGIARVVIGLRDPNPLVAGQGIRKLQEAGIEVTVGVEEEAVRYLNRVFLKYITTGLPWVALKTAMTLDGKIAARTGDSRWVTGEVARLRVQEMRNEYMGIVAGIGTVVADDPMLNCRLAGEVRQPVRIIADSRARIALDSRIVTTAREFRTIIAHSPQADPYRLASLLEKGVELICCGEEEGKLNIRDLMQHLGRLKIDSLLLEGGGELNASFIRQGCVDEVFAFIAPKLIGGREAKTPVEGEGFEKMADAVELENMVTEQIGADILIRGLIRHRMTD